MQCAVSTHPYSKLYSNSIICVKSICNAFFPHKKFPKFWTLRTKSYLYLKKKMQEIFPVLISLSVCSKSKVINFFFEIPILNFDTLTYQNNLFFGKYGTYTLFLCFILVPWPMNYYYAVPLFLCLMLLAMSCNVLNMYRIDFLGEATLFFENFHLPCVIVLEFLYFLYREKLWKIHCF